MLTLQQQLENALPGGHLHTILDFYAFDRGNLTCSYDKVIHCIKEELQARVEVFGYGSVVTGLALKKSKMEIDPHFIAIISLILNRYHSERH